MNSKEIVDLAIKRHDLDADFFQNIYSKESKPSGSFLIGRKLVLEVLFEMLEDLPKGAKILDVGCGTGHLTNLLKEKGYEVYGIEPSVKMLEYAKQNFPDIEIVKGISSSLPFKDNTFDFILSFEVLRYLDKAENIKTYKEFHRVLKPSGTFFVTHVNLFALDFYYFFYNIKEFVYKILNKIHHYCHFTTANREVSTLQKLGFKDINSVAAFPASIRIAYKIGDKIGDAYNFFVQEILKLRIVRKGFRKNLFGHLIVMAKK